MFKYTNIPLHNISLDGAGGKTLDSDAGVGV
jgi:hypothetical protein